MDYEKMYKAVLKTATQWIEDGCSDKVKTCLECIFPELRESEEDTYTLNVVQRIVGQNKPNEIFKIGNKKAISSYQIATWLETLPERFNLQSKQEQNDYITPHKEFFKFIYDRLINVHKENPNVDYMRSFKERLNNLSFGEKQDWSEEDEEIRKTILADLRWARKETTVDKDIRAYDREIAWLESLRPSWKPSEAQLMALHSVIDDESDTIGNEQLKLLYNDLKKLGAKEEPEYYQHFDPDC